MLEKTGVYFASRPRALDCRVMESAPPTNPLTAAISKFLQHSERVWTEYQQHGPNRLASTLFEKVDASANRLLCLIADLRDEEQRRQDANAKTSEWYDQLVAVTHNLQDLAQRCVCRVEGLCFFAPEAGLIPRRNLIATYEEGLAWLRSQLADDPVVVESGVPAPDRPEVLEFQPRRFFRNGHLQTFATVWLPTKHIRYRAEQHRVPLEDGDQVVLHDDCPPTWHPDQGVVLLIHGMSGCYLSSYMVRISFKLAQLGIRVFRFDLRGCGAGLTLARGAYHAGRSDDLAAVVRFVDRCCPQARLAVAGFSLGANILLKFLGEHLFPEVALVERAIAVNPPLNLVACERKLSSAGFGMYSRYFARRLHSQLLERQAAQDGISLPAGYHRPRGLRQFDDQYTAPMAGFENADQYYRSCSSDQFVPQIRTPTQIVASRDDPLIPIEDLLNVRLSDCVTRHVVDHGGHLAYIGRRGVDPDPYWIDWRVVDWATA